MSWQYSKPTFEYEQLLNDQDQPWAGHKNFAYDLVSNVRPRRVVELGTHWGTSYFSMAQAAKDKNLSTELVAIDTWQGDKHSGLYGEEVFSKVNEIISSYYTGIKTKLVRSTFDEALANFSDQTIDLLHIDGLHTYEAVKHDFDNWLPKVSRDGVILFHDTSEHAHDFGVFRFWEELKNKYKTVEFSHSHGLGVLFLNPQSFQNIIEPSTVWKEYYSFSFHTREITLLRERISSLDEALKSEQNHSSILMQELVVTGENIDLMNKIQDIRQHVDSLEEILEGIRGSKIFRALRIPGKLRSKKGNK